MVISANMNPPVPQRIAPNTEPKARQTAPEEPDVQPQQAQALEMLDKAQAQAVRQAERARLSGGKEEKKVEPPPPLGDGRKADKVTLSGKKPAEAETIPPLRSDAEPQEGVAEPEAESEAPKVYEKPAPVVEAIKEQVENLFRMYPNGGFKELDPQETLNGTRKSDGLPVSVDLFA
ncbi:MAG: hypothetical protein HQL82_02370 [Magnetococcales bacterium]|nr:hypothetical protein [Magnetococcales bacterium]